MAICRTIIEGRLIDFRYSVIEQGQEGKKCSHCEKIKPLIKIHSAINAETQIPFPIGRKRKEKLIPHVIEDWTKSLSPWEEGYPLEWEVCSHCGAATFIGKVREEEVKEEIDEEELIRASIENRPPNCF